MPSEKTMQFLRLIKSTGWRHPPSCWNEQLRESLSEQYVTVGFGGRLKLTDLGREVVNA
jgi:hypothetical protein